MCRSDTKNALCGRSTSSLRPSVIALGAVSVDISPTARALRTLEILQTRGAATAEELADSLGVTGRAARRYIAILREAGMPVESTRGPPRRLSPRARHETASGRVHADRSDRLGHGRARRPPCRRRAATTSSASPSTKVIRALPERIGRQAADLREHAATAVDRGIRTPGPPHHERGCRRRRGPPQRADQLPWRVRESGKVRSIPGLSWSASGAGTSCATPTGRKLCARIGSTGSARSGRPPARYAAARTSIRSLCWKNTSAPDGSSRPGSPSTRRCRRWRPTSVRRWAGSSRPTAGASSSARHGTQPCTRRSGWPTFPSRSASKPATNYAPPSPRSPPA